MSIVGLTSATDRANFGLDHPRASPWAAWTPRPNWKAGPPKAIRQPSGGDQNPLGALPARIAIFGRYLLTHRDKSTSHIDAATRDALLLEGAIRQLAPGRYLDISKPVKIRISASEDSRPALLQTKAKAPNVRRWLNQRLIWEDPEGRRHPDAQMTAEGLELTAREQAGLEQGRAA